MAAFTMPEWSIIIHGGAKSIEPHEEDSHREEALRAVTAGVRILEKGGTALDAVERAIKEMEEGGVFNAGFGSVKGQMAMCAWMPPSWTVKISISGLLLV